MPTPGRERRRPFGAPAAVGHEVLGRGVHPVIPDPDLTEHAARSPFSPTGAAATDPEVYRLFDSDLTD